MAPGDEGILWQPGFLLDDVAEDLEYFGRDYSDVVDVAAHSVPERAVALMVQDGAVTHAALAERGPHVATRKRRLTFRQLSMIGPISLDRLEALMPQGAARRVELIVAEDSIRVPRATWRAILGAIRELDPIAADVIASLVRSRTVHASQARLVQRDERDAVLLALAIAGIHRPVLALPDRQGDHFLGDLAGTIVSEDRLIEHDASRFPGWLPASEQPAISRTFADHEGHALTVLNVNRGPIERTTGVDLVYYREDTDSFVMVQYKRLTNEPPNWVYRPAGDKNWPKERLRMAAVEAKLGADEPSTIGDYHFESSPFFIKLCKPLAVELSTGELVGGLYLPLAYWSLLERAPEAKGKRGGVAIGFHNAGKWLTSTIFVELVKREWLGSSRGASAVLHEILRESLHLERSTILALESGHPRPTAGASSTDEEVESLEVVDPEEAY